MKKKGSENRGIDWNLTLEPDGSVTVDRIACFIMMDIRDELQKLNRMLGCANFTGIPATLRAIRRNTAKPRKPKAAR